MPSRVALLIVVSLLAAPSARQANAQHFGKNKVEYVDFDFRIFETEHFAVYYYAREEEGARIVSRLAERWYARLSRVLDHRLDGRQPLILYGSQPEFAQTNVVNGFLGEGVGGVTESARRRIVMPFAPTLEETDRILGHEITHAFQFDIARRYRGGLTWPLWSIEGLAQYLALGAADGETATWLRDAVAHDLVPHRQQEAARKFSPYRYGHALWAYLAGRFGDRVIPEILKARSGGTLPKRIEAATGQTLDVLFDGWRKAAYARYGAGPRSEPESSAPGRLFAKSAAKLYLGPSLSPDGARAVFFSERDRVSLDLFLADTASGAITRKLATTAASIRFESLQAIRSAGSWSPEGDRFVFAAIERGKPALVIVDIAARGERIVKLPQFGQILTPAWSPDGRTIAFSALEGGLTDLYLYDLSNGSLRAITNDPFTDLHPEWSPDGRRIAFITDRYSTDLTSLRFGPTELALADVQSGSVRRLAGVEGAAHFNPQWSGDGGSLFFLSRPEGAGIVHRIDLASGSVFQVTAGDGSVGGLTPTSPALSVARSAPVAAYTIYRKGRYDIEIRRGAELAGVPRVAWQTADATTLPPLDRYEGAVAHALADSTTGLPGTTALQSREYLPKFFLEALGPPYVSSGGGPLGTYVRGGGSFLFSDLLGERKVAVFAQAGNRMRDLALRVQFLNRERRWNWGAVAEVQPSLRRLPRIWSNNEDTAPAFTSETHYFERTQVRMAGILAYPLDRAQRIEVEAGARYTTYRRTVTAVVRSMTNGRVLSRSMSDGVAGAPTTAGEASAAYVRDTSVFGPTSPILGGRTRFEVATTVGELSATRVLLDHRRYVMPVKPYTVAMRLVHLGQYGRDADDVRVLPSFLGSRYYLRGYGWGSIKCEQNAAGECSGFDELLGSRLVAGNLEVRAPLLGLRSRDLQYGPVPAEAFVFADGGLVWSRTAEFSAARSERRLVRSFGIGVRLNALGMPLEWAAVRATDAPARGWSFGVSFRPAF